MMNQLELLDRGYAHGLVGQLPYEMGALSIQTLHDLLQGREPRGEMIGTNVLNHINIPLVLPELEVDHNLVGNLYLVGYILFGIVALTALGFLGWTIKFREMVVVKAAQPIFLFMVLAGVFLMGLTMIPLSFDDDGEPNEQSDREGTLICQAIPWSGFCGFTITFSALFAKTMRVNRLFHSKDAHRKTKVTHQEVMVPFALLLTANVGLLTLWTIMDPLVYTRQDLPGTDGWNRILATYGSCQSENVSYYLLPLAAVNVGVLVLANWQAYVARHVMEEFTEAKYIGLTMTSLLQATGMGVPILFVVRESPVAFYLLLVFMIFVICMAVLVLIFVPKLALANKFGNHSPAQQSRMLRRSVLNQSGVSHRSTSSSINDSKPRISGLGWSDVDLSRFDGEDVSKSIKFDVNDEDVSDPEEPQTLNVSNYICESIVEELGESMTEHTAGEKPESYPEKEQQPLDLTSQSVADVVEESYDKLAEDVEKRMAVHTRGSNHNATY